MDGIHNPHIFPFTANGAVLETGETLELDTVVLATGWEADYSMLSEELRAALNFADDGVYLYRQMPHPDVANLVFIGYASTITSVLTYNLQARWAASRLTAAGRSRHADDPSAAGVRQVAKAKVWTVLAERMKAGNEHRVRFSLVA